MGEPGSSVIWTPPLDELPFLPSLCHPWLWCYSDGYAIFFLALEIKWKTPSHKVLVAVQALIFNFLCDFKRWRNYLGVDTDAIIPPNTKLKAEAFVFENETFPPRSQRLSSLLCISSDNITRHVCYQQPADMWASRCGCHGKETPLRYRSVCWETSRCCLTFNQCNSNIISWGIFSPAMRNDLKATVAPFWFFWLQLNWAAMTVWWFHTLKSAGIPSSRLMQMPSVISEKVVLYLRI